MSTNTLKCRVCDHVETDYLGDHLLETHNLTTQAYLDKYPNAGTVSQRLLERFNKERKTNRRALPPAPGTLTTKFAKVEFPVNPGVPEDVCLPLPPHFRMPEHGELGTDYQHAAIALRNRRSIFIHGLQGASKDACIHAYSYLTRTPGIIRQVQPGADIESWFFIRSFDSTGTSWEEGELLKALVEGYVCEDGSRIPYVVLISDFDRADRGQAEYLRLVTDTIKGRVQGPQGKTYDVLPGTIIAATANTAGTGDSRGRCISANPIDSSILDRFDRKLQFHWMTWEDEGPIVEAKFPMLRERAPWVFNSMAAITPKLREAILEEDLYGEFSHRAVCAILSHAEDMIRFNGGKTPSKNLLKHASRCWLDGLPDEENKKSAKNIMDPHIEGGMNDLGNTSHVGGPDLVDGWNA